MTEVGLTQHGGGALDLRARVERVVFLDVPLDHGVGTPVRDADRVEVDHVGSGVGRDPVGQLVALGGQVRAFADQIIGLDIDRERQVAEVLDRVADRVVTDEDDFFAELVLALRRALDAALQAQQAPFGAHAIADVLGADPHHSTLFGEVDCTFTQDQGLARGIQVAGQGRHGLLAPEACHPGQLDDDAIVALRVDDRLEHPVGVDPVAEDADHLTQHLLGVGGLCGRQRPILDGLVEVDLQRQARPAL